MNANDAITLLRGQVVPGKAADMAAYHKAEREYLGVGNPILDQYSKAWRQELRVDQRLELADGLWVSNIHEARVCAAKLLAQARIKPDDTAAWEMICRWVPQFDAWAISDHACGAGAKRLVTNPQRIDTVEEWTKSDHMWSKRAALVMTLPWAKLNNPKPADLAIRERILGWAASYVEDRDWFIQKSIAWWVRDLSKREPERSAEFLDAHGAAMKAFARREAGKYL